MVKFAALSNELWSGNLLLNVLLRTEQLSFGRQPLSDTCAYQMETNHHLALSRIACRVSSEK